jgi:hypothetical protein
MDFIVVCAGIPASIYDAIYKERTTIVGPNGHFLGAPLKPAHDSSFAYDPAYVTALIKRLWEMFKDDGEWKLRDTGLLLVHIPLASGAYLVDEFFPFALPLAVDWPLEARRGMPSRIQKNELVRKLKAATDTGKEIVPIIKREVQSDASSTPLLLPFRNFKSDALSPLLRSIASEIVGTMDRRAAVKTLTAPFKRKYFGDRAYRDDRGIWFRSPGNARHAFARPDTGNTHRYSCLLAGRERLGAPYDRAFHYDCVKGDTALTGRFTNCHDISAGYAGSPHLNIAPNDYVR